MDELSQEDANLKERLGKKDLRPLVLSFVAAVGEENQAETLNAIDEALKQDRENGHGNGNVLHFDAKVDSADSFASLQMEIAKLTDAEFAL